MGSIDQDNKDQQNRQGGSEWNKGESDGSQKGSEVGGTAAKRAPGLGDSPASDAYKNETGDPGRTPGAAEGVEDFQKTGNE